MRFIQLESQFNSLYFEELHISITLRLAILVSPNSDSVHCTTCLEMLLYFFRSTWIIHLQTQFEPKRTILKKNQERKQKNQIISLLDQFSVTTYLQEKQWKPPVTSTTNYLAHLSRKNYFNSPLHQINFLLSQEWVEDEIVDSKPILCTCNLRIIIIKKMH